MSVRERSAIKFSATLQRFRFSAVTAKLLLPINYKNLYKLLPYCKPSLNLKMVAAAATNTHV